MAVKKSNTIFLVLFQLAVFTSPFLIKSFHHHITFQTNLVKSGTTLGNYEKPCLICQYEFVTFELNKPLKYSSELPSAPLKNLVISDQVFFLPIQYYSLRAPPIFS
jgi:hypothetical protein